MATPSTDLLTFAVNQGVAVFVLVFLLVRLETRMARLEQLLQTLADRAFIQAGGTYVSPTDPKAPVS